MLFPKKSAQMKLNTAAGLKYAELVSIWERGPAENAAALLS